MVYYVNDHLITEEVLEKELTWGKNNEQYRRIVINSCKVSKREEDGSFSTVTRTICAHNCSLSNSAKTRIINIIPEGTDKTRVSIRTSSANKYDNDVFVVAIPYDGLIIPSEPSENLGIYRTMILRSDRLDIQSEDQKYKRVIYLVVSPRYPDADGWYPTPLVVKSIRSNVGRNEQPDENSYWQVTTTTIKFGTDGRFEIGKTKESVPYDSINPDNYKNVPLFKLVEPIQVGGRRSDVVYESKGNSNQRNTIGSRMNSTPAREEPPQYGDFDDGHSMKGGKKNKKRRRR